MPDTPAFWGAVTAIVVAALGFWGTQRAKASDATTEMLREAREWAETFRVSEHECRAELAAVRLEVADLRAEIVRLRRELHLLRHE